MELKSLHLATSKSCCDSLYGTFEVRDSLDILLKVICVQWSGLDHELAPSTLHCTSARGTSAYSATDANLSHSKNLKFSFICCAKRWFEFGFIRQDMGSGFVTTFK